MLGLVAHAGNEEQQRDEHDDAPNGHEAAEAGHVLLVVMFWLGEFNDLRLICNIYKICCPLFRHRESNVVDPEYEGRPSMDYARRSRAPHLGPHLGSCAYYWHQRASSELTERYR